MDKKNNRTTIFKHLDGVVCAPIIVALQKKNIVSIIQENKTLTLLQIIEKVPANEGYLNVALRTLASQGFLSHHVDNATDLITISSTNKTEELLKYIHLYEKVIPFLQLSTTSDFQKFEFSSFTNFHHLMEENTNQFGFTNEEIINNSVLQQVLTNIEGCIAAPLIVQLGMKGFFHKYFMETSFQAGEFHKNKTDFEKILDFLTSLGWFTKQQENYKFTDTGEYFARRATSYGVTVSYLPMFNKIDDLLFGNANKIREISNSEDEIHVDRKMNVWGSGGAHNNYFKVVTDFIIDIFNQPIAEQPKGILDMGCGNGAFIQHIYETIEKHTIRGRMLEEYPLFLVGADYNQAALEVTRANLINNDIWAKVIWGDIGNPDLLASDLNKNYNINLSELLNIRTFLDHNRVWNAPQKTNNQISTSTGAFAFRGKRLNNNDVEQSLTEHLQKWLPYIKKHGLLIIELHTLDPTKTAENVGETAATAYDATHGFSDQYIVEISVLNKICKEIGLQTDQSLYKKFPNSDLATVSINLLKY